MQVDLESCCFNFGYSFQTVACFVLGYQKGKTFEKWRLILLLRGSYLQYAVMCYHEYQLTYSVLQSCYLFSLLISILGLRGLWPPSFHPGNLEICNCIPSIFSEECSQKAGNKISDKKYFTTVFIDTRLWKTKHPQKRFQNFRPTCVLPTNQIEIHQSQPASMT